jgi:indolepyruvate ferredoxin oxidoreductase beta subunit
LIRSKYLNSDSQVLSFSLVGVGGQGTILASNVLAELGLTLGYDVKKAEVHGMSQRGGSVTSYVRWGERVFSPIVPEGEADILVAFEKMEAARFYYHLRPGGLALVNDYSIVPITVSAQLEANIGPVYPSNETIRDALANVTSNTHWVEGVKIAESLGNVRTANVVILGALSALLEMESVLWLKVIEVRVPSKYIELNHLAFEAGRKAIILV